MNCIWITIDSLRQDHVHCYSPGGASDPDGAGIRPQTPSIDRLASEGVLFERLRTEALPTICARRAMFTGRRVFPWPEEPFYKGIYIHAPGWRPLPQEDVTVAEHLSEQGYVTGMVADVYHLMKPSMNFHRGFQSFEWVRGQEYDQWQSQPLPVGYLARFLTPGTELADGQERVFGQYLRNQMFRAGDEDFQAARTFGKAIEWLERNHGHERFFLYVDSFDPHEPCEAPQRWVDQYDPGYQGPELIYGNLYRRSELSGRDHHHIRARYAAEVSMVDEWVGRLLDTVDRLGLREKTLIVLLSDHGKILGEFDTYGMPAQHTGLALSAVPCVLRHPEAKAAGRRFGGWLYNTDVTATVLDLLGVEPKPRVDGESVWPAVCDGVDGFREHLVCAYAQMVSVWEGDWLYLVDTAADEAALYNLAEDPARSTDVSGRYPSVRDDLARKMASVAEPRG